MSPFDLIPFEQRHLAQSAFQETLVRGVGTPIEVLLQSKEGRTTPYYFTGQRVEFDGAAYAIGVGFDVTEPKRRDAALELERSMYRALTEHSRDITTIVAKDGTIAYESPAIEHILGYRSEELVGKRLVDFMHPDDAAEVMGSVWSAMADGLSRDTPVDFRFRHKDGTYRILSATGGTIEGLGLVANSRDVTEVRAIQERVRYLAHYDSLTGLPNRNLLTALIEDALAIARRNGTGGLLLFFDIDRFKAVNDSLGHHRGDRLLQLVAERLGGAIGRDDLLARHGGDEFVAIVPGAVPEDAPAVAQRLLTALKTPFLVEPHELHVACSIGICSYPDDGPDALTLIRNADTAMYEAKASGRNTYRRYTLEMNQRANRDLRIANDLHHAIAGGQLDVFYQPMIGVANGNVVGFEALVRWHKPDLGIVLPGSFIEIAEDIGLIERIGHFVLDRACAQLRRWHDAGYRDLIVAVNVSARQLVDETFAESLRVALSRHRLAPDRLELELTESIFVGDEVRVLETLGEIKRMGVGIAIDDFGIGYSNLGYLRRLESAKVKIDRSFVADGAVDPRAAAVIEAVVRLGSAFGFTVVAEGIETAEELELVRDAGCDLAQGFYLGRPLPASQIVLGSA